MFLTCCFFKRNIDSTEFCNYIIYSNLICIDVFVYNNHIAHKTCKISFLLIT